MELNDSFSDTERDTESSPTSTAGFFCSCNTFWTDEIRSAPFIPPSIQIKNLACWDGDSTFKMPLICSCIDSILLFTYTSIHHIVNTLSWTSFTISSTEAIFSCWRNIPDRLEIIAFFCSSVNYWLSIPTEHTPHAWLRMFHILPPYFKLFSFSS